MAEKAKANVEKKKRIRDGQRSTAARLLDQVKERLNDESGVPDRLKTRVFTRHERESGSVEKTGQSNHRLDRRVWSPKIWTRRLKTRLRKAIASEES